MRWHWQNLNERKHRPNGSGLRHGRGWLHFGERQCFGVEWVFFSRGNRPSLELRIGGPGGDHAISGHVSAPLLFAVYLHADRLWPRRWRERIHAWWQRRYGYESRELSISAHSGAIFWNVWCDDMSWSRSNGWRQGSWNYVDFLLGRNVYEVRDLNQWTDCRFWIDGHEYAADVKLTEQRWGRPRLPRWFDVHRVSTWIDLDRQRHVPAFSGKGENSWDCGDDAIFGMGSSETTPEGAIGDYIKAVLKNRARYGRASKPYLEVAAAP